MNKRDLDIADSCGFGPEEAAKMFAEAARRHEEIHENIEALYKAREERESHEDEGETCKQMIERRMNMDF